MSAVIALAVLLGAPAAMAVVNVDLVAVVLREAEQREWMAGNPMLQNRPTRPELDVALA